MARRQPYLIVHSDPYRFFNLDFEPKTISISNTTPFVCYVRIGSVGKPTIKGFDELIPPFTSYVGDPAGARDFAIYVDNATAPNTPFTFPVNVVFSEGSASVQSPLASSLVTIAATGYDGKLIGVFGASLVAYLPLNDLTGRVAVESVAAQNWEYGASNLTLNQAGIGDSKPSVLFNGAAAGQVLPTAPVITYLNGASKFNRNEGTMCVWVFVTAANMAGATVYIFCTIGVDLNSFYVLRKSVANTVVFGVNRSGTGGDQSASYSGGAWLHICGTWSVLNNRKRLYLNGSKLAEAALPGTFSASSLTSNWTQLASQNNAQYLAGYLAKYALGNRELSETEVAQLAQLA